MFKPKGPICQSCSMPLSKDKSGGGTEIDGSKSTEFCGYCYANGVFIEPDITVDEMMKKLDGIMASMKFPKLIRMMTLKKVPDLKRWQSL